MIRKPSLQLINKLDGKTSLAALKGGKAAGYCLSSTVKKRPPFPILESRLYNLCANGGDRLRQGFLATDGCHAGLLYAAR